MSEYLNTLIFSCIPAVISAIITYIIACKKAKTEISTLEESNKHELDRLMQQHQIDIDSLKEKYKLETEKNDQEHKHKIEILNLEHQNELERKEKELSDKALYDVVGSVMTDPSSMEELLKLMDNPAFKDNQ